MQTKFRLKVKYLLVLIAITSSVIAQNNQLMTQRNGNFVSQSDPNSFASQSDPNSFEVINILGKQYTEIKNDLQAILNFLLTNTNEFDNFSANMYAYICDLITSRKTINSSDEIEYIWDEVLKENSKGIKTNKLQEYQLNSIKAIMQHHVHVQIQYIRTCINEILQSSTLNDFVQKHNIFVKFVENIKKNRLHNLLNNDSEIVSEYADGQYKFKENEIKQHYTKLYKQYFETSINNILQCETLSSFLKQYGKFISDIHQLKDNILFKDYLDNIYNFIMQKFANKQKDINQYIKNNLQWQIPTDDLNIKELGGNHIQMLISSGPIIIYKYQQPLLIEQINKYISEITNIYDILNGYDNAIEYVLYDKDNVVSNDNIDSELAYILYYINTENQWAKEYVNNYIENKLESMLTNQNIVENNNIFEEGDKVKTIAAEFDLILQSMQKHEKYLEKYSVKSLAENLIKNLDELGAKNVATIIQNKYLYY